MADSQLTEEVSDPIAAHAKQHDKHYQNLMYIHEGYLIRT